MNLELGSLTGVGGTRIHTIHAAAEAPRADAVIVHGYAEHSARYGAVMAALLDKGFAVHALDHRGHGRSGDKLGLIDHWESLLRDLEAFLASVRVGKPDDSKLVMVGHSMGALATAHVLERHNVQIDAAVLSAIPLVPTVEVSPVLLSVSSIVARLAPTVPVADLDSSHVSRDPEVVAAYDNDPFVYHGKFMARTGDELLKATDWSKDHLGDIDQPALFMTGTADKITSPDGTDLAFEGASSADKEVKHYDGLYHEIFNEPEQETTIADAVDFLDSRTG